MTIIRSGEIWEAPDGTKIEWLTDLDYGDVIAEGDLMINGVMGDADDPIPEYMFKTYLAGPAEGVKVTRKDVIEG